MSTSPGPSFSNYETVGSKTLSTSTEVSCQTPWNNGTSSTSTKELHISSNKSKNVGSNVLFFDRPIKPNKEKISRWKSRNDSSQIKEAFSECNSHPTFRYSDNVKNQSNIKPASLSVTYQDKTDSRKQDASKSKVLIENTKPYKPPLVELQPEYLTTPVVIKSLKDVQDVNKKYSALLGKRSTQFFHKYKKHKLSPLKLCNENKLSEELGNKVGSRRKVHQLLSSESMNRSENVNSENRNCYCESRKNKLSIKSHSSYESLLKGAQFRKILAEANRNNCDEISKSTKHENFYEDRGCGNGFPTDRPFSCSHCHSAYATNSIHHGRSQKFSSKPHFSASWQISRSPSDNNGDYDADESLEHSDRYHDSCRDCPCPLHNVVKYRQQNFSDTHSVSPTNVGSKPCHKTYILDDRLFPIPIRDRVIIDPKASTLNNTKPVVTLNCKEKIAISGSQVSKSNHLPDNKSKHFSHLIPPPTNSLALKHQKGISR